MHLQCIGRRFDPGQIHQFMINLEELSHQEITSLLGIVRKEWVRRNKEKYLAECFKVGDVVKFRGIRKTAYDRKLSHRPDAPIYYGYIKRAQIQRTGRIQTYLITYYEGDEEEVVARGIHQVEKPTEDEIRGFVLISSVRKI
jgi:hypothetical protein